MSDETEVVSSLKYDSGLNDDPFTIWRNSDGIGWVQLSFRIIVEAMYDLICGAHDDILSASTFFYGTMYTLDDIEKEEKEPYGEEADYTTGSLYPLYAEILGYDEGTLPVLVEKHKKGNVTTADVENLRNLYTVMATI